MTTMQSPLLAVPWETAHTNNPHPMFTDPRIFLNAITNEKVTSTPRPHNEDGYILCQPDGMAFTGRRTTYTTSPNKNT